MYRGSWRLGIINSGFVKTRAKILILIFEFRRVRRIPNENVIKLPTVVAPVFFFLFFLWCASTKKTDKDDVSIFDIDKHFNISSSLSKTNNTFLSSPNYHKNTRNSRFNFLSYSYWPLNVSFLVSLLNVSFLMDDDTQKTSPRTSMNDNQTKYNKIYINLIYRQHKEISVKRIINKRSKRIHVFLFVLKIYYIIYTCAIVFVAKKKFARVSLNCSCIFANSQNHQPLGIKANTQKPATCAPLFLLAIWIRKCSKVLARV